MASFDPETITGTPLPRCIAVLAVHGVGDHPPCASARAVGDMLAGIRREGDRPKYSVFRESLLRLRVRKTNVHDHTGYLKSHEKFTWGPMNAIAAAGRTLSGSEGDSVDHQFMETQLAEFDNEKGGETYQFLRLDGHRITGDRRKIRVYEMYWADLSRLGTGFSSIFSEVYQLLFHLTSVGINNISAAAVPLRGDDQGKWAFRRWTWLRWLYIAASGIFAWPIAILNLFLAAFLPPIIGISLLHAYVPPATSLPLVLALYAAVAGAALAAIMLQFRRRLEFREFAAAFLLPIVAAGAVWWYLGGFVTEEHIEFALGILLLFGANIPIGFALQAYDRRRPGSLRAAYVLAGTCFFAAFWWRSRLTFLDASSFRRCWPA